MAETEPVLRKRLDEALAAKHTLVTKGGVTRIRHGEKWLEYKPATLSELLKYIADLEAQLGIEPSLRRTKSRRILF